MYYYVIFFLMKRNIFLTFILTFVFAFSSCASNDVSEKSNQSNRNNRAEKSSSYFEDWRYKGFGSELPTWFEPAYLKNSAKVRAVIPGFSKDDVIIGGNAISADHAEQLISINKNVDGYEFVDSCWAKLSKEVAGEYSQTPYVFLIVLKKINE